MERFVIKYEDKDPEETEDETVYMYNCSVCPHNNIMCRYPGMYDMCSNELMSRIKQLEDQKHIPDDKRFVIQNECGYRTVCQNCHKLAPDYYRQSYLPSVSKCNEECLRYLYMLEEELQ